MKRSSFLFRVLALSLSALLFLGTLTACRRDRGGTDETPTTATTEADHTFPFSALNASDYVSLSPEVWQNLSVAVDESQYAVTDETVEEYLHEMMAAYLPDCPAVSPVTDRPAARGDTVYIYYCGYDEGLPFDGGCNIVSGPSPLTLGSGSFIPGFEDGLVGVTPSATSLVRREKGAAVEEGDIVYFSYAATYLDHDGEDFDETGVSAYASAQRIDLAEADGTYGEGFAAHLVGQTVGSGNVSFVMDYDNDGNGTTDARMRYVGYVYAATREVTVDVQATFPATYVNAPDLAGKTVTFKVVVSYIGEEEYPALTASMVTDTFGYPATTDDPVSEFLALIRDYLTREASSARSEYVEGLIMDVLADHATVLSYPEGSVEYYADDLVAAVEATYRQYKTIYSSSFPYDTVEAFACDYLGLPSGTDFRTYARTYGEKMAKENLIVFLLGQALGVTVSEEDAWEYAAELADEINAEYGYTAVGVAEVLENYGREYVTQCVTYQKVMALLLAMTTVVPVGN